MHAAARVAVALLLVGSACGSDTTTTELSDLAVAIATDSEADAGTFTASGLSVDEGVICAAGATSSHNYENRGDDTEYVEIEFICDDGSGTFTFAITTSGSYSNDVWQFSGAWTVLEGSSRYETLTGEGTIEGECPEPDCHEAYRGHLRV